MDAKELKTAIRQLKSSCTDNQSVEVRESVGKMPSSIAETISAFANGSGGAIVLGLSEKNGFEPAERLEAHRIADALSQACSDKLTPPARASIDILEYDGANVVVATIDEIPLRDKPCLVKGEGMYQGSFIRSFDGDRKLSPYEINRLLEDKTQPSPAAVREAVCNAIMHRDYSELARGTQVQVNLYDDRLEFLSPGGLYGTVTAVTVASAGYSSTRNQYLADILEPTPYEGGLRCGEQGGGLQAHGDRAGAKPDGSASRQGLGRDVLTRVPSAYGPAVDRLCLRRNSLLRLCERAVRRRGDFRWFEHPQEHRHVSPEEACRREEAGEDWDGKKPEPEIPSAVAAGSGNGRIRPLIRGFGNDSLDSRNRRSLFQSLPGFRRDS